VRSLANNNKGITKEQATKLAKKAKKIKGIKLLRVKDK
jgi:hypothetical protein